MALPFSFVAPTVYGQMILSRYDINQTGALLRTGAAEGHGDIELMRSILATIEAPHVFVDVGANVGAYSLGLTSAIGSQGKIYAFEPQRIIFNMLAGTMALNGVTNVFCHNIALGEREDLIEIPQFDYDKSLNFGSIEFGPQQKEALSQTRGKNPEKIEYVRLATLDSFEFTNVNLLKIDAEGMEMQILEGANQTISNCRPVMYIEFFKSDRTALQQKIISHDYDVHVNGVNFLCIPRERSADIRVRS
ncbi:FkbM family methyltransferase [Acidisoma sp. L85]|jgi:FkbM family methyltransferase|uniref:FkbM family methyltransferase n=1 Tax=Acidisoma sp. L85 TaxID=1641850 RepID=UPI00131D1233|nr:FkbM family methyltransferase [Acidisoma sp. L85]